MLKMSIDEQKQVVGGGYRVIVNRKDSGYQVDRSYFSSLDSAIASARRYLNRDHDYEVIIRYEF